MVIFRGLPNFHRDQKHKNTHHTQISLLIKSLFKKQHTNHHHSRLHSKWGTPVETSVGEAWALACCVFKSYNSPASGWRRWEGYRARMKAEWRGVCNAARHWKGGGGRLRFMQHAMELDGREAEITDPLPHSQPRNISNKLSKRVYFIMMIIPQKTMFLYLGQ